MTVRTLHILNTYRITNIRTVCPALLRRYVIEIDWKLKFEVIKPAGTNWNLRWIILYLCNLLGRVRYSTACQFPSGNLLYNNDRQFRVQINNSVWLGSKRVLIENRFTVNSWFRHTSADRQILATWRIGCARECRTSRVIFEFWARSVQPKIAKFWPEIKWFGQTGILKFGTKGGLRDRSYRSDRSVVFDMT